MPAHTLYDKIWGDHAIATLHDGMSLIGIDRHLLHEVTTPQAFEGLRLRNRVVAHPELCLATPDHNVPTRREELRDDCGDSFTQIKVLKSNTYENGIEYIEVGAPGNGIVHVIGPEQGFTLPGLVIVCGDSHTSTHGALGALGFGIGTSEIEHVLATQTLLQKKSLQMLVLLEGELGIGVSAKDVALALIGAIGTAGATGFVIEFAGPAVERMSIEARMTLCNMSIELGARAGLVSPDEMTFAYLEGRARSPKGEAWQQALAYWRTLKSDDGAEYDRVVTLDLGNVEPSVTWGTSPEQVSGITGAVPHSTDFDDVAEQESFKEAIAYMGLVEGMSLTDIVIDNVFIGSCTNSRIEDLRSAADILRGRRVADNIRQALVVPGSVEVKRAAEAEGLDKIFLDAGFEWREPGCSMCLAMNPDRVPSGERCASTSNRNFKGRQGPGARTHLMSPAMAAGAAVAGRLIDIRQMELRS